MLVKHSRILSYVVFTPKFLLDSIALTVSNIFSACPFDFRAGRIKPGTFDSVLTSCCSGHMGSSMELSGSISDSKLAVQSSSLSFGLSNSPSQLIQSSLSEVVSGVLPSSLSTGWRLILRIRQTFNIWVRPPRRSFADRWWQRRSFWQCKCSRTIMSKKWWVWFDDLFRVRHDSHSSHLLVSSARFLLSRT